MSSRSRLVRGAVVFLAAVMAAGAAGPATGQSGGGSATVVQASGGTDVLISPSNLGVGNADALDDAEWALRFTACPKPLALPKPPKRDAAIAAGWKATAAIVGKRGPAASSLAAARRTKGAAARAKIPNTVVAGVATGSPRAALAASLRGAELEPDNQRHYINAAVLLIGYGRFSEANGLLAAAAKIKTPGGTPFDMGAAAVLRAAQAELALATGRFAKAEAGYRAAAKAAPLMAEARLGVAHALKCQRKLTPAVRWKVRGDRRKDGTKPDDPVNPSPAVLVEEMGDADLVHGVDLASFGTFRRPANAADGAAAHNDYRAAYQGVDTRFYALLAQENAIRLTYTRALRRWVAFVNERVQSDAKLKAFIAKGDEFQDEWLERTKLVESRPECYYTDQHTQLFDLHRRHLEWAGAYARHHHRLLTSLAAQVGDPSYSKLLNIRADQFANRLYSGVMQLVYYTVQNEWSERADEPPEPDYPSPCYRGTSGGTPTGQNKNEDSTPGTDPCSAAKAIRTKIKIGSKVSAEFNCEGGKVEVVPVKWGIDPAYVGLFGEAGVKWKNGDVTAVAGVKTAVSTDGIPGVPPAGVSGKVGVYVTAGKGKGLPEFGGGSKDTYTVKDYGVRVQSTAEVPLGKAGAVTTITKFDDKIDISLVGVFSAQE